jgi:hypothetical protein
MSTDLIYRFGMVHTLEVPNRAITSQREIMITAQSDCTFIMTTRFPTPYFQQSDFRPNKQILMLEVLLRLCYVAETKTILASGIKICQHFCLLLLDYVMFHSE